MTGFLSDFLIREYKKSILKYIWQAIPITLRGKSNDYPLHVIRYNIRD
jgi:hypothetical protein